MLFVDDLSKKFRVRRRLFSLFSTIAVVAGFGCMAALNQKELDFGGQELMIILFVLLLIYVLKKIFWKCPSCNRALEMGGIHVSDLRRSNLVRCPHCGVVLE